MASQITGNIEWFGMEEKLHLSDWQLFHGPSQARSFLEGIR